MRLAIIIALLVAIVVLLARMDSRLRFIANRQLFDSCLHQADMGNLCPEARR